MSFFDTIGSVPEDPIFSVQAEFVATTHPKKVNLGIGAYRDAEGKSLVFTAVRKAEHLLLEKDLNKEYLPIAGNADFIARTGELLFGKNHPKLQDHSIFGAQTVGGTAALRIAGEFFAQDHSKLIHLPNPTWANHKLVFNHAKLKIDYYPYYNFINASLDFHELCTRLRKIEPGHIILLHGTSHNPTGLNPSLEQWKEISRIMLAHKLIPLIDVAYQGFGLGIEEDAQMVRLFVQDGHEMLVTYTYAKNMGLYGERTGAIFAVTKNSQSAHKIGGHLKQIIRSMYSNPPLHGSRIVSTILSHEALKNEWIAELNSMRERVSEMRKAFVGSLLVKGQDEAFNFLTQDQTGLFAYTGLNTDQVQRLKTQFGVFMPDGRINLAGLNWNNLDYVVDCILSV